MGSLNFVLIVPTLALVTPLERPIVEAAGLLLDDQPCLRRMLRERPFTDDSLPRVGGNVPRSSRLFRSNYERPLPVIGNALRAAIDDYEKGRRYDVTGLTKADTTLYYERVASTAALDLDYLDLLRNTWLQAIQDLEAADDDDDWQVALAAARRAATDYIRAARIDVPPQHQGDRCQPR